MVSVTMKPAVKDFSLTQSLGSESNRPTDSTPSRAN